jgi:hypothetical protein
MLIGQRFRPKAAQKAAAWVPWTWHGRCALVDSREPEPTWLSTCWISWSLSHDRRPRERQLLCRRLAQWSNRCPPAGTRFRNPHNRRPKRVRRIFKTRARHPIRVPETWRICSRKHEHHQRNMITQNLPCKGNMHQRKRSSDAEPSRVKPCRRAHSALDMDLRLILEF